MLPHAEDNCRCSLLGRARPGTLFGASIFRAGRPGCPLTHMCFYKYPLPNVVVEGQGCLSGQGKGARGSKDGKKRGRGSEERRKATRRKFRGRGAQGWAGSGGEVRGPCHESSFVAAALGSLKFQRAASRRGHWRGDTRTSTSLPSPARIIPQVRAPVPRAPPAPLSPPPAAWVLPCGLRWQRCWPGAAAGRWGRAGRSPLRSGGPPHRAPGKPEAGERRCPLLGLAATRGRRQKRVKGEKVTRTWWPRPTPPGCGARSPRGRAGDRERGRPGAAGGRGRRHPALPRGGARAAAKLSRAPGARASSRPGGSRCGRPQAWSRAGLPTRAPPPRRVPGGGGPGRPPAGSEELRSSRVTMSGAETRARRPPGGPRSAPPRRRLCSRSRW